MTAPLYRGYSMYAFVLAFLGRIALVVGFFYLVAHFEENQVLIGMLMGIDIIFLCIIGHDVISVWPDKIIRRHYSIGSIFLDFGDRSIAIASITKAALYKERAVTADEVAGYLLMKSILPESNSPSRQHQLRFEMKDGSTELLLTDLGYSKCEKIVAVVQSLIV